jgi:hypothetical protein
MKNKRECFACGDEIVLDNWAECDKCGAVFCDKCIDDNLTDVGDREDPRIICSECISGKEDNTDEGGE